MATQPGSDVARLLIHIREEYEAGVRGLTGLTYGVSQHVFITQRMENMSRLHQELHQCIGDEAMLLIAEALDTSENEAGPPG